MSRNVWRGYPKEAPQKTGFYRVKLMFGDAVCEETLFFLKTNLYQGFETCFDSSEKVYAWRELSKSELKEAVCQ